MQYMELKPADLNNKEKKAAILVDVREQDEFTSGYIEGAINLPLSVLSDTDLSFYLDQEKEIVIYCRSGGRSAVACEFFIQQGAKSQCWNLSGGILEWQASGYDIIKD